ncbi:hypothetical protein ACOME3_001639 [Neoechinorhynchus agilis]
MRQQTADASIFLFSNAPVDGIAPYADIMIDHCKKHLIDPSPEVRRRIAKLMAVIVSKTSKRGGKAIDSYANWFIDQMKADIGSSTIQKMGAAQGLCELSVGMGEEYLHEQTKNLLKLLHQVPSSQYASLVFFDFLAVNSPKVFTHYVGSLLVVVLELIGNENEEIRGASASLGKRLVDTLSYDVDSINLLINEIKLHLFDNNWRVRGQAVILLGDLLFKISCSEDYGDVNLKKNEQGYPVLKKRIGSQNTDRTLSELFISSNDIITGNAQKAAHIWKVLSPAHGSTAIMNSLLPTILDTIKKNLIHSDHEVQFIMAKSIGELYRLIGADQKAFNVIVDELLREVNEGEYRPIVHCGVLKGIAWILEQSYMIRDSLFQQSRVLVGILVDGMGSSDPSVRSCLSLIVPHLLKLFGVRRTAEILMECLKQLSSNEPPIERDEVFPGEKFFKHSVLAIIQTLDPQSTQHLLTCLLAEHKSIKYPSALVCFADSICRCSDQKLIIGNIGAIISLFLCSIEDVDQEDKRIFSRIAECLDGGICGQDGSSQASLVVEKLAQFCSTDRTNETIGVKVLVAFVQDSQSYLPINEQLHQSANDRTLEILLSVALKLVIDTEKAYLSYQLIDAIVKKMTEEDYIRFVNDEPKLACASILFLLIPYLDVSIVKQSLLAIIGPIIRIIGQKCSVALHTEMVLLLVTCLYHEDIRQVIRFFGAQLHPALFRAISLASNTTISLMATIGLRYLGMLGVRQEIACHNVSCGLVGAQPNDVLIGSILEVPAFQTNTDVNQYLLVGINAFESNVLPFQDESRRDSLIELIDRLIRSQEKCLSVQLGQHIEQHSSVRVPCNDFRCLCGLLEASLYVSEKRLSSIHAFIDLSLKYILSASPSDLSTHILKSLSGLCLLAKNRPDAFEGVQRVKDTLITFTSEHPEVLMWICRILGFLGIASNDRTAIQRMIELSLEHFPIIAVHFAHHLLLTDRVDQEIKQLGFNCIVKICRGSRSNESRDAADQVLLQIIGSHGNIRTLIKDYACELQCTDLELDGDDSWITRIRKIKNGGVRPLAKLGRELVGTKITNAGDLDGYTLQLLI